ncbi:hypothetical protein D3C77_719240 [compost metagenome]
MDDLAVLMLGVVHRPLPHLTFPHPGSKLPARARIVVVDRLVGLALENFFRRRAVAFGLGENLGEVDDAVDAHGAVPVFV